MLISPVSHASMASPAYGVYASYGLRLSSGAVRGAMPEAPVEPVRPAPSIRIFEPRRADLAAPLWRNAAAAEQAARSRVQYVQPFPSGNRQTGRTQELAEGFARLDWDNLPEDPAGLAVRMRIRYPGDASSEAPAAAEDLGAQGVQKAASEGRCETCEKRKYQDGSDDSSVSYQTPTEIDPDAAPAAVRGHEMEHVYHQQAEARREGRKVVSQTVTLHTDICPECGRSYISGGTTRTVTKEISKPEDPLLPEEDSRE